MLSKILLAEDEDNLRKIITSYLTQADFEVIQAKDGAEASELFQLHKYALVILDVMMPKKNGYQVCREIRELDQVVPIIILTARDSEQDELEGFQNGADEYIAKPFRPSILLVRIKSLLKRSSQNIAKVLSVGPLTIRLREHQVLLANKEVILTPREFDLLYYLVTNKNIALSREQIISNVWGMDFMGDDRTIDTHIKSLRAKLAEFGSTIKTIRKYGYKLEVDLDA
ncbi:MAG: response regulator transcription factor [Clostridia bacterium]